MLEVMLADNTKARKMLSDGSYVLKEKTGEEIVAQEVFMKDAMNIPSKEIKEELSWWKRLKQFFANL